MKKKLVFKIEGGEILIVTASTFGTGSDNKYVSVTGWTIKPILKSEVVEQVREDLEEGEAWRMAVEARSTELGLQDWIDYVINNDGELSGFDNSIYDKEVEIGGEDYIFSSESGGCIHDIIGEATNVFDVLILLHLKSDQKSIKMAEKLISNLPTIDVDAEVFILTEKIILEN